MADITSKEVKERLDAGEKLNLIDVREPHEWEADHISDLNIPLGVLPVRANELEHLKGEEVIPYCRSGGRSGQATMWLKSQGFSNVRNLAGGMLGWKATIDSNFNVQ